MSPSLKQVAASPAPEEERHKIFLEMARVDDELIDRLASAGHDVQVLAEPYAESMGHAGAVLLHPDGTLEGAHDPRADGGAAGL